MENLKSIQTIIFDYDGTLHDSTKIYIPAFKKAYEFLIESKKVVAKEWDEKEITKWLGHTKQDMWNQFMPDLEQTFKLKASDIIGQTMIEKITSNEAKLYPGSIDTLKYLKNKGYRLVFLSHCSLNYMKTHEKAFHLSNYFDEMYCSEMFDYKLSKKEIVEFLGDKISKNSLVIGDRQHDFEIAQLDHVSSIGCTYGFGTEDELKEANLLIDQISDLKNFL